MAHYLLNTIGNITLGYVRLAEESSSPLGYGYYVRMWYTPTEDATKVNLYVGGNGYIYSYGGTVTVDIDGVRVLTNGSFSANSGDNSTSNGTLVTTIDYDPSTGQWGTHSINIYTNCTYCSASWVDTRVTNHVTGNTIAIPDITPKPTITGVSISIANRGFEGLIIAGLTTLRYTATFTNTFYASASIETNGIVTQYEFPVTGASQETQSIEFLANSSVTDYVLSSTLTASNDTSSESVVTEQAIRGYSAPVYGSGTSTSRCIKVGDSYQVDGQGDYGYLNLTWQSTSVGTNIVTNVQVEYSTNGGAGYAVITPYEGSIGLGYQKYAFPLATNLQGDLRVTLTDKLSTNIITSLSIPKMIIPFSMYHSGDDVGVTVGRMATSDGLWCYVPFYLKSETSNKIFKITVDDNGNLTTSQV